MIVVLTEQIKLTFASEQDQIQADHAFSEVTRRYADACTYVSEYYFCDGCVDSFQSLHHLLYKDVRFMFGLKSQMSISVFKTVLARYKTVEEQVKQQTVSYSDENGTNYLFRKSLDWLQYPIRFRRPQADLVRGRDWGFLSGMAKVSVNTLSGRVKCMYECRKDSRLFDPSWKHGGAKLVFHESDKNWYLHISVSKVFPGTDRSKIRAIDGHDRGLINLTTSYKEDGTVLYRDGQHVCKVKGRYAKTRASLQSKGTKGAKRVLKRISGRENRMMQDKDHCISKTLVTGNREHTLHVFEDLNGISFENLESRDASGRYALRSWTFYSLEQKTAYKAAMRKGMVLKVDPKFTSQRCPVCGTVDKTARDRLHHKYTCKHCGRSYNDDEVAAINLRQLGLLYVSGIDEPSFSK